MLFSTVECTESDGAWAAAGSFSRDNCVGVHKFPLILGREASGSESSWYAYYAVAQTRD